jgi:tRNA(fMet)-specific endonuclease VapC
VTTYLLDSNAVIEFLRGNASVCSQIAMHSGSIVIHAVVLSELFYGARKSKNPLAEKAKVVSFATQFPVLAYEACDAEEYANIRHELSILGLPIGQPDLLIAATARTRNLTVVTHNTAHFGRIPNLQLVDWEIP